MNISFHSNDSKRDGGNYRGRGGHKVPWVQGRQLARRVDASEEDISKFKDARRENRRVRRETSRTNARACFSCRKIGHIMAQCPKVHADNVQETGMCFHCGSTQHGSNRCTAKMQNFQFAKCFVCSETGHLSKNCPKNSRGLYPNGGACLLCNQTDHLKKDCHLLKSDKAKKAAKRVVTEDRLLVGTSDAMQSADQDVYVKPTVTPVQQIAPPAKKKKIIFIP